MEFHVTNTFLQTFLLISVGYLSFFFEITNFTDRIMVALTTMLVIATISTASQGVRKEIDIRQVMLIICSISNMLLEIIVLFITFVFQGLPKTAYYKAIDYWFFFTLTTMIVTMLCHTITAYTIRRAQAKSLSVLEDTSFFRNKIRPVHSISGSGPETR